MTLESSENIKVSFNASKYDVEKLKVGQKVGYIKIKMVMLLKKNIKEKMVVLVLHLNYFVIKMER